MHLPPNLEPFFWEYDVQKLTLDRDKKTIMTKILSSATWDGVTWLRSHVSDQEIRDWIIKREGRGLDPKRLRFWELILDLPRGQVNMWIERMESSPREARKDFIDIYDIGKQHRHLGNLLPLCQEKFGIRDIGHLLYSLSYFEVAEQESMPEMNRDVDWTVIKPTIQDWGKTLSQS